MYKMQRILSSKEIWFYGIKRRRDKFFMGYQWIFLQIYYNLFQAGQQKNCPVRKSWDKSENSANGAAQYSPWWSVAQPWVRHRITWPKTGIDGYGVPVRNGIFANAMISPDHHCHHDAACFCRNTVNAVAVIMRVQGTCTQGYASLTLGCLTLAAP